MCEICQIIDKPIEKVEISETENAAHAESAGESEKPTIGIQNITEQ
jgi:hypothetical protein